LLSDAGKAPETPLEQGEVPISRLDVAAIEPNPYQPRHFFEPEALQELADSIRVQGVIQPITVRALGGGRYQLIAGERRWQASKLAGLTDVPAFVRQATDQQMMEVAIIENIQRQDLNAMEVARSLGQLMTECHLKQEELAERVGKKRSTVANYLRLLKLPPDIAEALDKEIITMGHARAILGLDAIDQQLFVFGQITKKQLSVRETEVLVQDLQKVKIPKPAKETPAPYETELKSIVQQLSTKFGTKIGVKQKGDAGEISIPYGNLDELNRVLEILL
jgi:ParB family chromosome partitioning protein